jgi:ferredoxin
MTARVRVEPAGVEFGVNPGDTVFRAAAEAGFTWPTVCFGGARCTACALTVLSGHNRINPPGRDEQIVLAQLAARRRRTTLRDVRLACRMTVSGDVVVEKKGVKPVEVDNG